MPIYRHIDHVCSACKRRAVHVIAVDTEEWTDGPGSQLLLRCGRCGVAIPYEADAGLTAEEAASKGWSR